MLELINFVGALLALVATFFRRFAPDGPQFSAEEAGMYGLAAGLQAGAPRPALPPARRCARPHGCS